MNLDEVTTIAKALSDNHRLRAVAALRGGELCACQLIELVGLAPSTVSKHMSILKQAGIVESRKAGKWVYYRLKPSTLDSDIDILISTVTTKLDKDSTVQSDALQLAKIKARSDGSLCT